jgi:hypothetical protein
MECFWANFISLCTSEGAVHILSPEVNSNYVFELNARWIRLTYIQKKPSSNLRRYTNFLDSEDFCDIIQSL